MLVKFRQFFSFLVVGSIGFVVEATVLYIAIYYWAIDIFLARLPSFAIAVTTTWLLNRIFTFSSQRAFKTHEEYQRYLFVQIVGAIVNFIVYALVIVLIPILSNYPIAPLAAGSAVGLFVNYRLSCLFVFTGNNQAKNI